MNHATRRHHSDEEKPSVARPTVAIAHAMDTQLPIHGKGILVVDDEREVALVLVEVFSQDGHTVDIAGNGEEALEKLQHRSYDVIVCDIRMPRLNGPGLYYVLAQRNPQLLSRLLFLRGDILSPQTQEFLQRTAAPALDKPFALEDIRQAVQRILQRSEPR
jgi:two-component system NtrC family sensor kinase